MTRFYGKANVYVVTQDYQFDIRELQEFYVYMDPNYSSYRSIEVVAAAKSDGTKMGIDVGGTTMYWSNSIYDIH